MTLDRSSPDGWAAPANVPVSAKNRPWRANGGQRNSMSDVLTMEGFTGKHKMADRRIGV